MPIVSHTITATSPNGTRKTVEFYLTDNLAVDRQKASIFIKLNDDPNPVIIALYTQQDQADIDTEIADALSSAKNDTNPDRVPVYQTQAEFDRRLLGELMLVTNVHTFHTALPFFQAVEGRGGANAGQRATYLGVTTGNYNLIAARFGDDQGVAFFLDNVKGQIWDIIPEEFS